jgi:SNF2 family DNA or RNA helicase
MWRLLTNNDCTFEQWKEWFLKPGGGYHEGRLKMLGEAIKGFSRVRTKKEVAPDLPETTIRVISVNMEGEQEKAYSKIISDYMQNPGQTFETMLIHLASVCSHPELPQKPPQLTQECAKLLELRELLEGFGEVKGCIWSWHPSVLQWLARVLPYKSVQYHGQTPPKERERAIHEFNHGNAQIFLGNPSACGTGLNLPNGEWRIFWDCDWSPVEYTQACGRIERGLSYTPRTEYRLVARHSIEEMVWQALEKKENLKELILSGKKVNKETYGEGVIRKWVKRTSH